MTDEQRKHRVLLVDDNAESRLALWKGLEQAGFEVQTADGVDAATTGLDRDPPDVVVLEFGSPLRGAREACTEIRDRSWGRTVPIISSTRLDDAPIRELLEAGVDDIIGKPVAEAALVHRIRHLLERVHAVRALEEEVDQLTTKVNVGQPYQANFDSLTGLPAGDFVQELLGQAISAAALNGQTLGLLVIDPNDFKRINDSIGLDAGDVVLRQIAQRLGRCVRQGDALERGSRGKSGRARADNVARGADDEFVMIVTDVRDAEDVGLVAKRVREVFARPFRVGDAELIVHAAIGIAVFENQDADTDTLLCQAKAAMRLARAKGVTDYRFFEGEGTDEPVRFSIEEALNQAIVSDHITVAFQPQICLADGSVTAIEALARWSSPEHGVISPKDFMPVAEASELVIPLGLSVLRMASERLRELHDQGHSELRLSLNVSAEQFGHAHFLGRTLDLLNAGGIRPSLIELEIDERCVLEDPDLAISRTRSIGDLGMGVSLARFGSGRISVAMLAQLTLSSIKIDRSLMFGFPEVDTAASIVLATISLAHTLGLEVVAEGVESSRQLAELESIGCDRAQGFHIGRPLLYAQLTGWMSRAKRPQLTAS